MIERVFIKEYLSLKSVELNFQNGLMAFTGASGAGKSLLMQALLSLFGLKDSDAKFVEASLDMPLNGLNELGIEEDEPNIIKYVKDKKARYFINSQAVSKKNMKSICGGVIRYLSLRDEDEFSSSNMLELLDKSIANKDKNYQKTLDVYAEIYEKYINVKSELQKIAEEEKNINELKEFAKYEIESIEAVNPNEGEDEELMSVKKSLSKKEKITEAIEKAQGIFEFEGAVHEMLELLEIGSEFFDECMNELRVYADEGSSKLEQLEDIDIESLLERIEQISKLKQRFGSIEEINEHKQKRLEELKRYENITFEKENLQKEFDALNESILKTASQISQKREANLTNLEQMLNGYLQKLYLKNANLGITKTELSQSGQDTLEVKLNDVDIKRISSGELNRIRLAFIACKNEIFSSKSGGILILDEVDANLSGKEAYSVANVIKLIAKNYQVLAISHQPQLSSVANTHFLVDKKDDITTVKELDFDGRVKELARMVSGDEVKQEAVNFAKKLLEEQK